MKIRLRYILAFALASGTFNPSASQAASAVVHSTPTGSYTLVQPMNQFRKFHTATQLSNGKLIVVGGSPLVQAATSELYDPQSQTWSDSGALNVGAAVRAST